MNVITRAVAALLLLIPVAATAKDDYVYGPPPDWAAYRQLGKAAIRALLADPTVWAVEWPNGYKQGVWPMKGHPQGYVTCGIVRAIKPIEGGYPSYPFAVVIDRGEVKGVDYKPRPSNSVSNLLCQGLIQRGALPPAAMMTPVASATTGGATSGPAGDGAATIGSVGIEIRPMPEGAYVTRVAPGSVAAGAELKPGMVIASVNAVPLAGMGEAMVKVLDAAGGNATLAIIGGATIKLGGR